MEFINQQNIDTLHVVTMVYNTIFVIKLAAPNTSVYHLLKSHSNVISYSFL